MGWFDFLTPDMIGDALNIGGRLLSTNQLQSGNDAAAQASTEGMQKGADILSGAYNQSLPPYAAGQNEALARLTAGQRGGVDVYNRSAATASGMYQPYAEAGPAAVGYYKQLLGADPYRLTPQQMIEMDDATRRSNNALATGGLRGSGRAVAAVHNDLQNRTRAGMISQNMTRQKSGADALATLGAQATGRQSEIESARGRYGAGAEETIGAAGARAAENIGTRTSDTIVNAARPQASAAEGIGSVTANQATANAEVGANSIGNISSIIAQQAKATPAPRPYYLDFGKGSSAGGLYQHGGSVQPDDTGHVRVEGGPITDMESRLMGNDFWAQRESLVRQQRFDDVRALEESYRRSLDANQPAPPRTQSEPPQGTWASPISRAPRFAAGGAVKRGVSALAGLRAA